MDILELVNMIPKSKRISLTASAYHSYIKELCEYYEKIIFPQSQLINHQSFQNNQKILGKINHQIYIYMSSLTRLDKTTDYQAIGSITRTIFECYVDFNIIQDYERLQSDGILHHIIEKHFNYPAKSQYQVANNISDIDISAVDICKDFTCFMTEFVKEMKKTIEKDGDELIAKHKEIWNGCLKKYTWHGIDRRIAARYVGLEDMYSIIYPIFSWTTHSCPAGFEGSTEVMADLLNYYARAISSQIFIKTSKIVVSELKLKSEKLDIQETLVNFEQRPNYLIEEEFENYAKNKGLI